MRTNLTNFFARFRGLGVGDAKKAGRFSDDIGLVLPVGGIPPWYTNDIPGTLGNVYEIAEFGAGPFQPTVELIAGGRGLWLLASLQSLNSNANVALWTLPAPRVLGTPLTVILPTAANCGCFGDGTDSLAEFRVGSAPADLPANIPTKTALTSANGGMGGLWVGGPGAGPVFIAAGQVVTQQRVGASADFILGFGWKDVPL